MNRTTVTTTEKPKISPRTDDGKRLYKESKKFDTARTPPNNHPNQPIFQRFILRYTIYKMLGLGIRLS